MTTGDGVTVVVSLICLSLMRSLERRLPASSIILFVCDKKMETIVHVAITQIQNVLEIPAWAKVLHWAFDVFCSLSQFIHCNCDPDFKDICIYFVTYPAITYFVFETSFQANLLHVIPVIAIKWLNFMCCSKSPITFETHTLHHTSSIWGPRFSRWRSNKVSRVCKHCLFGFQSWV